MYQRSKEVLYCPRKELNQQLSDSNKTTLPQNILFYLLHAWKITIIFIYLLYVSKYICKYCKKTNSLFNFYLKFPRYHFFPCMINALANQCLPCHPHLGGQGGRQ